ncbi:KamA family radical SAM protein [Candidatus Falkowbacteria bacterium]|nr:KamA family radical SAM protein [Candidatus Falkowbacteria bacterium]
MKYKIESDDPLAEKKYSPVRGIIKKYSDRVIFCPTYTCPSRCDFCFRKNMVNGKNGKLSKDEMAAAIDYIKKDKTIREVILSGGDPLFLPPKILSDILKRLSAIPHIKLLRVHTRIPVTLPSRITKKMAAILRRATPLWIIIHINHPKEITPQFKKAVAIFTTAGIPLLSQSVLLRGINDDVDTLKKLFYSLVDLAIKPYYLHQCDPARGTKKYWVPIKKGKKIMRQLRKKISGICLPTYVQDSPHRGKTRQQPAR